MDKKKIFVIKRIEDNTYFRTNKAHHLFENNWTKDINDATVYSATTGRWSYFDDRFYQKIYVNIVPEKE